MSGDEKCQETTAVDVEQALNSPKPILYRIEHVPPHTSEAALMESFPLVEQPRLTLTSLCDSVDAGTNKLTATVVYRPLGFGDAPHLLDDRMAIDRDFFGFTSLYTPSGHIEADIIALTGLGGHAFGSWAVSSTAMWLRDFLPEDIPQARTIIYGYDSRIQKRRARSILSDYTNNFILKLMDMRKEGGYEARPVILVGHSLGCLIIKEALIKLASFPRHNQNPLPVTSLIFFGAPHRGLDTVAIKTLVEGSPSEDIVQELKKQSPTLTRLNDDFRHLHGHLEILTLYELEDTPSIRETPDGKWRQDGPPIAMVEKDSAILYLPNEQRVSCNADHRHMARVVRGQDGCYSQLRTFIQHSLAKEVAEQPAKIPSIRRSDFQLESISKAVDSSLRHQILEWVSPIKYENAHNKVEKTAMSGTGQWLLQHDRYAAWHKSQIASNLWLNGFMGSGKSCLAHVVIEDVRKTIDITRGERLAFFYCDGTDAEGASQIANTNNILRSFVKQLSDADNAQKLMTAVINSYHENHHKADLTEKQSFDLIVALVNESTSTTLVIDGLDECALKVQRTLTARIKELLETATGLVKVYFSSRRTPEIEKRLAELNASEIQTMHHNKDDINFFIETQVARAAEDLSHLYKRGGIFQTYAVLEKLKQKAQGMFRWVQLSLEYLHTSVSFREMSKRIHNLDQLQDLFDLYDEIYRNIMETRDLQDQLAIRTALTFLAHGEDYDFSKSTTTFPPPYTGNSENFSIPELRAFAQNYDRTSLPESGSDIGEDDLEGIQSPLVFEDPEGSTIDGEIESVSITGGDVGSLHHILQAIWFNSKGQTSRCDYTTEDILAMCPSLIILDNLGTWTLAHFSVREFLVERHPEDYSIIAGNAFLAQLCMEVCLKLDSLVRTESRLVHYAAFSWIKHLIRVMDSARINGPFDEFLNQNEGLRRTLNEFLLNERCTQAFLAWNSYMYSAYEKAIWKFHFDSELTHFLVSSPPSSIFVRLLLDYHWDLTAPSKNDLHMCRGFPCRFNGGFPIIHFVTLLRNMKALDWFLGRGLDVNNTDGHGRNALGSTAGWRGEEEHFLKIWRRLTPNQSLEIDTVSMMKTLIQRGIDVNARDRCGETPIFWMFEKYSRDTCEIVKLLAEHGADPLAVSDSGLTALEKAIGFNDTRTLTSIIEDFSAGALERGITSVNSENFFYISRQTLFHNVAKYCTEETIRLWFEYGADQHIKDSQGKTALDYVKERGIAKASLIRYLESVVPELRGVATRDVRGRTPFHFVVQFSAMQTVQRWIGHGADPYLKDKGNTTPIDIAKESRQHSIVRYLEGLPPSQFTILCDLCRRRVPSQELWYCEKNGGGAGTVCAICY